MKVPRTRDSFRRALFWLDDDYGACPICGAIFGITTDDGQSNPEDAPTHGKWLWDVILLDLDKFDASGDLSLQPVRALGGGFFQNAESPNDWALAYDWNDKFTTWDLNEYPQYAAFHPLCWQLAERVVTYLNSYPKSIESGPFSMRKLVEMYKDRESLQMATQPYPNHMWCPNNRPRAFIQSPVAYYGPGDTNPWDWQEIPPKDGVATFWRCPFSTLDLTQFIFSCLEPILDNTVSTINPQKETFTTSLLSLPNELYEQIVSNVLNPVRPLPLLCTRLLPQSIWRQFFIEQSLLPWLWDLDFSRFDENSDENWDWELFCRQLSQVEIFEMGHKLEHAPLELRNRRRIWRLVEEIRFGDCPDYGLGDGPNEEPGLTCTGPPCMINHYNW